MKRLFLYAVLLLLTQCSKCKDDPKPTDKLPPETQTGANTFGCLLNGQVWLPKGGDGTSNFSVDVDPAANGVFDLRVHRSLSSQENDYQYLIIYANQLQAPRAYDLSLTTNTRASLSDRRTNCYYNSRDANNYCRGRLNITRLDLRAGIVAGTFEFVLAKPGCDTIKVTQGRFDKKL